MIGVYQQIGIDHFRVVDEALAREFPMAIRQAARFSIPAPAFDPLRRQYDACRLLEQVSQLRQAGCTRHVFVVDVDLYAPERDFVFGAADRTTRCAVVSMARLAGVGLDDRLAKEIVHETGHLFGCAHCDDPRCVMYYSRTIADTDRKAASFCAQCRRIIEGV